MWKIGVWRVNFEGEVNLTVVTDNPLMMNGNFEIFIFTIRLAVLMDIAWTCTYYVKLYADNSHVII